MSNFIIYSIVASIVLTVVLNVLPLIFPNAADKLQKRIEENSKHSFEQHEDATRPRVKVFFPWKAMLIGSIVLTIIINVLRALAR